MRNPSASPKAPCGTLWIYYLIIYYTLVIFPPSGASFLLLLQIIGPITLIQKWMPPIIGSGEVMQSGDAAEFFQ